ncbi:MAG TPA: deoxyribose-phosphate aldolase [Gammaproteobacteria bacterium]|nr:deoxyribose-phosphate aldolase [Gammaproteobacteria bacterium]
MTDFNPEKIMALLDLTSLNGTDTEATIIQLCQKAVNPKGSVAAVCVYPRFVKLAQQQLMLLDPRIHIATVSNFPAGTQSLSDTLDEINTAIADGADEIDVVMPYQTFLQGNKKYVRDFIASCKSNCDQKTLKVILETGVLATPELITEASHLAIDAGADFIKTSTGKTTIGATLEAAEAMLRAIRTSEYEVGFKAAGGVRTVEQAQSYIDSAIQIMGSEWISPQTFRIGASQLVDNLLGL